MAEAPITLEGWYTLHHMYAVDWGRWNALAAEERDAVAREAVAVLDRQPTEGHSACYSLLTQKGDLCFVHWRPDLESLRREETALDRSRLRAFLVPSYSYLAVIELGTRNARRRVRSSAVSSRRSDSRSGRQCTKQRSPFWVSKE